MVSASSKPSTKPRRAQSGPDCPSSQATVIPSLLQKTPPTFYPQLVSTFCSTFPSSHFYTTLLLLLAPLSSTLQHSCFSLPLSSLARWHSLPSLSVHQTPPPLSNPSTPRRLRQLCSPRGLWLPSTSHCSILLSFHPRATHPRSHAHAEKRIELTVYSER